MHVFYFGICSSFIPCFCLVFLENFFWKYLIKSQLIITDISSNCNPQILTIQMKMKLLRRKWTGARRIYVKHKQSKCNKTTREKRKICQHHKGTNGSKLGSKTRHRNCVEKYSSRNIISVSGHWLAFTWNRQVSAKKFHTPNSLYMDA